MKTIAKLSVVLFLVVILAISFENVPLSYSAELATAEKASAFATNVVGLDMSKYVVTKVTSESYPFGLGGSYNEQITQRLEATGSKIEVTYDFRDKELVGCHIWTFGSTPIFTHANTDALDAAKSFLDRYQSFSKVAPLQTMRNTLNSVKELNAVIVTEGDVKLSIYLQEYGLVLFDWMNTVNGIKNIYNRVGVAFRNGAFEQFYNNWNLYPVGSADVKFSKEQAVDIAKERARTFSYGVGDLIVDNLVVVDAPFAELTMQPRANGLLYPHWEIYLTLDKVYPANVACLHIMMWADTGEISSIKATSTLGGFPSAIVEPSTPTESPDSTAKTEDSSASFVLVYLIAAAAVAITIPIAAVILKKRRSK